MILSFFIVIYPDFFPWQKTPAEDENVLKYLHKGYQYSSTLVDETLSEKTRMVMSLKHEATRSRAFIALSYVMSNSMRMIEKSHRFTSSSTFKPPPRVTLTELTKEAWLRDLANPSVPLRRLSRTIPHGTRNRSLLEQCCNKEIPISRAVWFARCVGANELRGLRRKNVYHTGQSSEAAWVREWTEQVTEYIEKIIKDGTKPMNSNLNNNAHSSTSPYVHDSPVNSSPIASSPIAHNLATKSSISSVGSSSSQPSQQLSSNKPPQSPVSTSPSLPNVPTPRTSLASFHSSSKQSNTPQVPWKSKMEYMLRLSSYLYDEDLLDKRVFLQWCVNFCETCKLHELPAALLYLEAYWSSIIRSTFFVQSLALGLLRHYSALSSQPNSKHPLILNLCEKISQHVKSIFLLFPDIFVIPNDWKTLGPALATILKGQSEDLDQLFSFISKRNENLIVSDSSIVRTLRNPTFFIIDALDNAKLPFGWKTLTQTILSNSINESEALKTTFEWATTNSRSGSERLYTCLSLVTFWHEQNQWNISNSFINFLEGVTNEKDYSMNNIYDLLTELLDRDWFSISDYFRRLISSGVLQIPRFRNSLDAQLKVLANIPVQFFDSSYRNQQVMILQKFNKYDPSETKKLESVAQELTRIMDFISSEYDISSEDLEKEYFELNPLICQTIESFSKGLQLELSLWLFELLESKIKDGLILTISQFSLVQNVFEKLRDLKSVYRVVELTIPKATNSALLSFLSNFVRDNLVILSALADVSQIIHLLVNQFKGLKTKSKVPRGLWDLANFALHKMDLSNIPDMRFNLEQLVNPGMQHQSSLYQYLQQPAQQYQNQQQDITTLSPMSDSLPESLSTVSQEFSNLLNLSNGSILKEQLDPSSTTKYFTIITTKLLEGFHSSPQFLDATNVRQFTRVLQYLRENNTLLCDKMLSKWLKTNIEVFCQNPKGFTKILLFLIIYECISLEKVAEIVIEGEPNLADIFSETFSTNGTARASTGTLDNGIKTNGYSMRQPQSQRSVVEKHEPQPPRTISFKTFQLTNIVLNLVTSEFFEDVNLRASEKLALDMHCKIFEKTCPLLLVKFIDFEVLGSCSDYESNPNVKEIISAAKLPDSSFKVLSEFLLGLSVANINIFIDQFSEPLIKSSNPAAILLSRDITAHLLKLQPYNGSEQCISEEEMVKNEITKLANVCNNFNVHLCQVHLRTSLCAMQTNSQHSQTEFSTLVADIIINMISNTEALDNLNITPRILGDLLIHLSKPFKSKLLYKSEVLFLTSSNLLERKNKPEAKTMDLDTSQAEDHSMKSEKSTSNIQDDSKEDGDQVPPLLSYLYEIIDAVADSVEVNIFSTNKFDAMGYLTLLVKLSEAYNPLLENQINGESNAGSNSDTSIVNQTSAPPPPGKDQSKSKSSLLPDKSTLGKAILLFGKIVMIHSSELPTIQGYEVLLDKLVTYLARLLNTQFVKGCNDLFGLIYDIFNTLKNRHKDGDEDMVNTGVSIVGNSAKQLAQIKNSLSDSSRTGVSSSSPNTSGLSAFGIAASSAATSPNNTLFSSTSSSSASQKSTNAFFNMERTAPLLSSQDNSNNGSSSDFNSMFPGVSNNAGLESSMPTSFGLQQYQYYQQRKLLRELNLKSAQEEDSYLTDLKLYNRKTGKLEELSAGPFDLLEESNPKMQVNDVAINLALFDGLLEKPL